MILILFYTLSTKIKRASSGTTLNDYIQWSTAVYLVDILENICQLMTITGLRKDVLTIMDILWIVWNYMPDLISQDRSLTHMGYE